jgi:GNAT superfamily N-acetyltransferase
MSNEAYFIYGIARGWLGKLEEAATSNIDSHNPKIARAAHFLWDAIANFCDDEIILYISPSDKVEAYAFYIRYQDPKTEGYELHVNTLGSLVDTPGIGSIIINEVIQQAKRIGFNEVTVRPDADAVGFYKKLGFVNYPGSYDDEYLVYWIHESPKAALNLNESLPATLQPGERPVFYSPRWVLYTGQRVPRYVYHIPEGNAEFGKTIEAYPIREIEAADSFGAGYKELRYVWLSQKPAYGQDNVYIIDLTRLDNASLRFTGQIEGNLLHRGDIPASAVVAIMRNGRVTSHE